MLSQLKFKVVFDYSRERRGTFLQRCSNCCPLLAAHLAIGPRLCLLY
jgi:hypothetical protein